MVSAPAEEVGMLNWMDFVPGTVTASRIACRKEPAPESLVVVTVKIAPPTATESVVGWLSRVP